MTDEFMAQTIGIAAGALSFFAYMLYVVSMVRGTCRPNRMTWFTLTIIGAGLATSYYMSGARETMWVALSYTIGPLVISLFSIKYGVGGWGYLDRWCILGVGVSLMLWWMFKSALMGLIGNLLVDFFALIPTIKKSITNPASEDRLAWTIETSSNLMNLFAIRQWTFAIFVYPVYLLAMNSIITVALWWPRRQRSVL